jgi:MOSC domain-containing protein YiiM
VTPDGEARRGRVLQVNVNPEGGVPKWPVPRTFVSTFGVEGDLQRDFMVHGGPWRAVSLYALERIEALRAEGHPIGPGTTGENLTLVGLPWEQVRPGDRLAVGAEVLLEITDFAEPCATIMGSFTDWDVTRLSEWLHPGWSRLYARVLREGTVSPDDAVTWRPRPAAGWPDQDG